MDVGAGVWVLVDAVAFIGSGEFVYADNLNSGLMVFICCVLWPLLGYICASWYGLLNACSLKWFVRLVSVFLILSILATWVCKLNENVVGFKSFLLLLAFLLIWPVFRISWTFLKNWNLQLFLSSSGCTWFFFPSLLCAPTCAFLWRKEGVGQVEFYSERTYKCIMVICMFHWLFCIWMFCTLSDSSFV